jgi:hypothetical protein
MLSGVPDVKGFCYVKYVGEAIYGLVPEQESLCGLVVRVLGYRSGGPGSIPGTTRKKKLKLVSLEQGPLSLVSTNEEILGRKVAVPV